MRSNAFKTKRKIGFLEIVELIQDGDVFRPIKTPRRYDEIADLVQVGGAGRSIHPPR
jgi:hypothetical protein